jgi:Family of unknown function (DUF6334)
MPDLQFDWEAVAHRPVLAVLGRNQRRMSDGSLAWDALALALGDDAVVLTITADTDEIIVSHQTTPGGEEWVAVSALADAMGKPLGWCWFGTNYRGYRDSFTLALGDVVPDALRPRLTFLAEASSLSCFDLMPRNP